MTQLIRSCVTAHSATGTTSDCHALCQVLLAALLLMALCLSPALSFAAPATHTIPKHVSQKLERLTNNRLQILNRNLMFHEGNKKIQHETGQWTALYHNIDAGSVKYSIKPMAGKKGQYLASIKYAHLTYANAGNSKKQAMNGPFTLVKRVWKIEILRYAKGQWQ